MNYTTSLNTPNGKFTYDFLNIKNGCYEKETDFYYRTNVYKYNSILISKIENKISFIVKDYEDIYVGFYEGTDTFFFGITYIPNKEIYNKLKELNI